MPVRSTSIVVCVESGIGTSAPPHQTCARLKARQCEKLAELRAALLAGGFDTAAKQAMALGLSRSSAWKILRGDHKHSGLSASTIKRMLTSPNLPPDARKIIDEYVWAKLQGAYGHPAKRLQNFRLKLSN